MMFGGFFALEIYHFTKELRQPTEDATATQWEQIFNDVHIGQFSSHVTFQTFTRCGREGLDTLLTILASPSIGAAVIARISVKRSPAFVKIFLTVLSGTKVCSEISTCMDCGKSGSALS